MKPAFVKLQESVVAALSDLDDLYDAGDFNDRQQRHVEAAMVALGEVVEELGMIAAGEK